MVGNKTPNVKCRRERLVSSCGTNRLDYNGKAVTRMLPKGGRGLAEAAFQTGRSGMTRKASVSIGCADMRQSVGVNRRSFVKAGILGTTGLSLAQLLRSEARADAPRSQPTRRPSAIILWMRGGPSHIDM